MEWRSLDAIVKWQLLDNFEYFVQMSMLWLPAASYLSVMVMGKTIIPVYGYRFCIK